MSLGKQLAAVLQKEKDAADEKQRIEDEDKRKKIALRRKCRVSLFDQFKKLIEEKIPVGKIPTKKVTDYEMRRWLLSWVDQLRFGHTLAEDADVITDFNAWLAQNDLALVINQEHDGMGMEEWIVLTVEPKE